MGAPLSVMFVLAAMSITLHDVLVTTVTGELVAHPAGGGGVEEERQTVINDKRVVQAESELTITDLQMIFLKRFVLK